MKLIDSHCHIHDPEFFGDKAEEVYQRAVRSDIGMIVVGTDEASSQKAVEFAKSHDLAWAAVGVHPHDTRNGWEKIKPLLSDTDSKVVAIGEIGLDYFYNHSPKDIQITALEEQLQFAIDYNLPVSFHVRDAFSDFWPIFHNFPGVRGVLHSFTDSAENAYKGIELGLYIGINGISTFTKDQKQQQLFQELPLENIVLETDAPFLTPAPLRGKMNEVGYVELVAKHQAEIKKVPLEVVMEITLTNTRKLFNI